MDALLPLPPLLRLCHPSRYPGCGPKTSASQSDSPRRLSQFPFVSQLLLALSLGAPLARVLQRVDAFHTTNPPWQPLNHTTSPRPTDASRRLRLHCHGNISQLRRAPSSPPLVGHLRPQAAPYHRFHNHHKSDSSPLALRKKVIANTAPASQDFCQYGTSVPLSDSHKRAERASSRASHRPHGTTGARRQDLPCHTSAE